MKKFLTVFFVTLGIIFFCILIALAYFWFADPFELRPLLRAYQTPSVASTEVSDPAPSEGEVESVKNPNLTPAQENALELIGVDVTALPDTITSEQMSCFVRVLGESRVREIQSGAAPSAIEIFKAKECL